MGGTSAPVLDTAVHDAGPGRAAFDWSRVAVYVIGLVAVAITAVPVLYVVIGGFRTTGQIAAPTRPRCPTPGC